MRPQAAGLSILALSFVNLTLAGSLMPRQEDVSPQTVDLNGPQITYEGRWESVGSPCNAGGTARRSDNSLAQDVKATITFAEGVKGFTLSMQAQSNTAEYTVAFEDTVNRYTAKNTPSVPSGETSCPVLLAHNFSATGPNNVTIALRLPRSAKRDQVGKRQGFQLPWIQINEAKALFATQVPPGATQTGGSTPSATEAPGAAVGRFILQSSVVTAVWACAAAILLA